MISLPDLEVELIDLLRTQGMPIDEIRLIGLLGQGTRSTAFSVIVDNIYHVLKVYDSKESLWAELKNLRKVIPRERLLFWWQERAEGVKLNMVIIEVPEGQGINSQLLTPSASDQLADRLAELHRIRYRQRVSLGDLRDQLERLGPIALLQIDHMGGDTAAFGRLLASLERQFKAAGDVLRTRKVRLHGDLWWSNVVAGEEGVYLIDWESLHRGDSAVDIAKLRLSLSFPTDAAYTRWFWQNVDDSPKAQDLMERIVKTHIEQTGDEGLAERLSLYLPLHAIEVLAMRYLSNLDETDVDLAIHRIIAHEAATLFKDPLAAPPDLSSYGYWDLVEQSRLPASESHTPND